MKGAPKPTEAYKKSRCWIGTLPPSPLLSILMLYSILRPEKNSMSMGQTGAITIRGTKIYQRGFSRAENIMETLLRFGAHFQRRCVPKWGFFWVSSTLRSILMHYTIIYFLCLGEVHEWLCISRIFTRLMLPRTLYAIPILFYWTILRVVLIWIPIETFRGCWCDMYTKFLTVLLCFRPRRMYHLRMGRIYLWRFKTADRFYHKSVLGCNRKESG